MLPELRNGLRKAANRMDGAIQAAVVIAGGMQRSAGRCVGIFQRRLVSFLFLQGYGMAVQSKRIVVHGRVQGVGFRYFVRNLGMRLGLTGDVSNLPDSTVEIIVEGSPGLIAEFIREVQKGPSLARVERLEIHDLPGGRSHSTFHLEGW
jgi:acylphosphatase